MSKIVDYMITTDIDRGEFVEEVRSLIEEGRQPLGGVAIVCEYLQGIDKYIDQYTQAMVKYETVSPKPPKSKYCQSNGRVLMSMPPVHTCKNCGKQWRGGQPTPLCGTLPYTTDND